MILTALERDASKNKKTKKNKLLHLAEMISLALESDRHWERWDDGGGSCPGPGTGLAAIT